MSTDDECRCGECGGHLTLWWLCDDCGTRHGDRADEDVSDAEIDMMNQHEADRHPTASVDQ